jgi:hypothetical protein
LDAICEKAENLDYDKYPVNVFCSFQMLEHLENPIYFLKKVASSARCSYLVISVPYVERGFIRLGYIRNNLSSATPEDTHVFELAPDDWQLIFKHSGWEIVSEKKQTLFPQSIWFSWLRQILWGKDDALGNYVVMLKPNDKWRKIYESDG